MQRLTKLSNKYQKRLIRPIYAQTQATPYATSLDDQTLTGPNAATGRTSFRNADGSRNLPKSGDTSPLHTRTADAYTFKSSLTPGLVMVRAGSTEKVAVSAGPDDGTEQPFGLLANWIGGELDDIGEEQSVGVWRGPDSVFELLSPAWDDTGLATALATTAATKGGSVYLYAGADGRLVYVASPNAARQPVARVLERPAATRIVIELLV